MTVCTCRSHTLRVCQSAGFTLVKELPFRKLKNEVTSPDFRTQDFTALSLDIHASMNLGPEKIAFLWPC